MRIQAILIILIFVLLFGCSDQGVNPPSLASDDILKNELVGIWKNDYRSYRFYQNGFFIDTSIAIIANSNGIDTAKFIRNGNYSVVDGFIRFSNVHHEVDGLGGCSIIDRDLEITIKENELALKMVDCLDNVQGDASTLWGKWTITQWAYDFILRDSSRITYEGQARCEYSFNQDSSYITFTRYDLAPSPFTHGTFTWKIFYNSKYLLSPFDSHDTITVSFRNNKMLWYYSYAPNIFSKVH
jgi:hypothetical protein